MDLPDLKDQEFINYLYENSISPEIINKIIINNNQAMSILNHLMKMETNEFKDYSTIIEGLWEEYKKINKKDEKKTVPKDIILVEGETIDKVIIFSIKLKLSSGYKKILNTSGNLTIKALFEAFASKMNIPYQKFVEDFICVYNTSIIDINLEKKLNQFFQSYRPTVVVYVKKGLIGAKS